MSSRLDRLFMTDAYEDVDDSDHEHGDSSDDDVDIMLHGTERQIKQLRRRNTGKAVSSDEDEFEKEMKSELDETMKSIENNRSAADAGSTTTTTKQISSFYDNSYFDSDSDEEGTSAEKKARKHPIPTNDELFYDPNMDDDDQNWIDNQRRAYQPKSTTSIAPRSQSNINKSKKPKPLPLSDAVLNCPGCMSLLCLDCQRHTKYSHQYRAMFVTNCTPDMTEVLHYPIASQKLISKKALKRKRHSSFENKIEDDNAEKKADDGATEEELFHPVKCDLCKTEVAVYDQEEVYHFFNVLASY